VFSVDHVRGIDAASADSTLGVGLVAHLTFDNGFTDSVTGETAFCLQGTGCPAIEAGKLGNAAHFNGSAHCLTDVPIRSGTTFTVAFWMNKPDDTSMALVARPIAGANEFWLVDTDSGAKLRFWTYDAPANANAVVELSPGYAQNTWTHVAVSYDGSSARRLYINGVLAMAGGPVQEDTSTQPIYIGCSYVNSTMSNFYNGLLDDVRVYDRALQTAEVADLARP